VSASEPLGVGFGWIDVERLRATGRPLDSELERVAGALGPGGRAIAESPGKARHSGVDPAAADRLISTATSYTLALRLDGVDSRRARTAFGKASSRTSRAGGWTNFDIGPEWSIPGEERLAPLGSLAARPATRPRAVLLARSSLAREAMERPEPPANDSDQVAAAAGCLGDVLAARLVLNNHTHLPNSGPDLLAFGVSAEPADLTREVLCVVGDAERVGSAVDALGLAFAEGERDGVSGEPMRELVADARVDSYEERGLTVGRAVLDRAPGTDEGFLFGAFDRGSVLTYIGLQPPPSPGAR
jgi:hypothetical protein